MKKVIVLYATRHGQTRKIAERVAADLGDLGLEVQVRNLAEGPPPRVGDYDAAVLAASVHLGRHEREMVRFAREHRGELDLIPTAFLSVSLSEAGAEDPARPLEARRPFARDVARMTAEFVAATGWYPGQITPVAGALAYTHYNLLPRFFMRRLARKVGAPTDTSRDHEFTDWAALDEFAAAFGRAASAVH